MVKRGWDAQVLGEAPYKFKSAVEAVKTLRAEPNANDQYLPPFVIVDESGNAVGPIVDGDAVVTFNFRADRMTMLAKALEYADFDKFDRVRVPKIRYAGMLQYDGELKLPSRYLVSPPEIDRTSGEYLVKNGIRTFACRQVQPDFSHSFLSVLKHCVRALLWKHLAHRIHVRNSGLQHIALSFQPILYDSDLCSSWGKVSIGTQFG